MSLQKVAVVTGGNKGIGYAIVKGLCEKFPGIVYLTARSDASGKAAVKKLNDEGLKPFYHQLNIDDQESVDRFGDYIKNTHGGIDVLVNNAGIAFKHSATEPLGVQAEVTLETNYFGQIRVCDALFPLLRQSANVINVSSCLGHLSKIPSADLREKLSDPALTVPQLTALMKAFIKSAKENKNAQDGWGNSAYAVSKVGFSALTRVHQRQFDEEQPNRNVFVNSLHPGYVATDMTSFNGPLSTTEGALSSLYLALEPHGLKGQFVWRDCTVVDWLAESLPAPY